MVKILHYYLLTLMLLMLSIGARAEDKTVTFIPQLEEDYNLCTDGFSMTKEAVTISLVSASYNGAITHTSIKIQPGKPFTVSCSAGNIKKIVLTGNDAGFDPDKLTVTDGVGNYAATSEAHQWEWTGCWSRDSTGCRASGRGAGC